MKPLTNVRIFSPQKDQTSNGWNTLIEIDGRELPGVKRVAYEVWAGPEEATLTIELVANITIDAKLRPWVTQEESNAES